MPLASGTRIGVYQVVSLLGAGGMGEVYRAHDTQLKRDVALKVRHEAFADDPDRLARFQREAELLATVTHQNIAAAYGLQKTDGLTALVLELVEGETLADILARGPLAVADALPIAGEHWRRWRDEPMWSPDGRELFYEERLQCGESAVAVRRAQPRQCSERQVGSQPNSRPNEARARDGEPLRLGLILNEGCRFVTDIMTRAGGAHGRRSMRASMVYDVMQPPAASLHVEAPLVKPGVASTPRILPE